MRIRGAGRTDPGRKRDANEDAFLVDDDLGLYVVSDGMGGHLAGEVASRTAIDVVARELHKGRSLLAKARRGDACSAEVVALARDAMSAACREVHAAAATPGKHAGMGCTLTMAVVFGSRAVMAHVGDCRLYLFRSGEARQLSEDHTLARELSTAGLPPLGILARRYRRMLTREIGSQSTVAVDAHSFDVRAGDILLLCSDGLSNHIESDEWLAERLGSDSLDAVVDGLVRHANESGGEDNITAVVVHVDRQWKQTEPDFKAQRCQQTTR